MRVQREEPRDLTMEDTEERIAQAEQEQEQRKPHATGIPRLPWWISLPRIALDPDYGCGCRCATHHYTAVIRKSRLSCQAARGVHNLLGMIW